MQVEFASNGSQAEGTVSHSKNMMDWDCTFIVDDVDKKNNVKVKPKVKLKLGNLFKTKKEKEEDKKKAEAEKSKKPNLFRQLFKKK